jgi:hypothetical protein
LPDRHELCGNRQLATLLDHLSEPRFCNECQFFHYRHLPRGNRYSGSRISSWHDLPKPFSRIRIQRENAQCQSRTSACASNRKERESISVVVDGAGDSKLWIEQFQLETQVLHPAFQWNETWEDSQLELSEPTLTWCFEG